MSDLVLRKATDFDMKDIIQIQLDVFHGEQRIPAALIPLPAESFPQWWCAFLGTEMVGEVGAWKEDKQVHWGRFAIRRNDRGLHIGTKLARFSMEDLFSQGIEEIHMDAREITVKIVCNMGGKIIGEPTKFYEGTVTPVVLCQKDYGK